MNNDWDILLIGGTSGTGKSYLARQLAQYFKIPLTELDDIRIALQTVANRKEHPDLFTFVDNPDFLESFDEERFVTKLVDVGRCIWPTLDVLITKHIKCNEKIIFEGDGILPELLASKKSSKIKSIFLYDELERIRDMINCRNRHGTEQKEADKRATFSNAYGKEIEQQAKTYNLTLISAFPTETLFERCLDHLNVK